jgi:hypothetical protein
LLYYIPNSSKGFEKLWNFFIAPTKENGEPKKQARYTVQNEVRSPQ